VTHNKRSQVTSVAPKGDVTMANDETRQCPYCNEEIKAGAIICKHCGSRIGIAKPEHGGTCPYCKESIHPEAILCKHCRSNLQESKDCGCLSKSQGSGPAAACGVPPPVSFARPGGGLNAMNCSSYCHGSILWCVCHSYVPGLGVVTTFFPCGTCINDPIFTAFA
jgi:uncharacterized CHY-type Zn-finger protein